MGGVDSWSVLWMLQIYKEVLQMVDKIILLADGSCSCEQLHPLLIR
jgi:hypothetical protein